MAYKHYNWFVIGLWTREIKHPFVHLNQPDCICTFLWSSWPSHHLQSLQEITFQESTPWCFITAQFNSHDFRSGGEGEKTFIGFGDRKSFALLTWPNSIYSWCSVLSKQMAWICMCPWEMPNMADQLKAKRHGISIWFQLESKSSTFRKGMKVSIRFHWSVEGIFEYCLYMFEWFLSSIQSEVSKSLIAEWDINPSRNSSVSQNRWEMGQMFLALV